MAALVAGIEDAAATGKGLACQIGALETNVARAHRRRGALIVAAALVAVLVLLQGAAFLRLEALNRQELRLIAEQTGYQLECSVPGHPAGESPKESPGDGVHECYDDRLRRTAEAVARARDASVATGQCVVDRAPDVKACVGRMMTPLPPKES